jgi:hypothetical protein
LANPAVAQAALFLPQKVAVWPASAKIVFQLYLPIVRVENILNTCPSGFGDDVTY